MLDLHFRRLDQGRSVVAQIVAQFREWLINGQLQPGAQIPPEPVLCERLGVSRTSVREAIRTLVAVGVVEVRRGNGTFVSSSSLKGPAEFLGLALALSPTRRDDLVGVRLAMEHACGRLAIDNATEADIAVLHNSTDAFEAAVRAGRPATELRNADLEFHHLLFDATHNMVFAELGKALMTAFAAAIQQAMYVTDTYAFAPAVHREILAAVEARSIADYDFAVDRSLNHWRKFLASQNEPRVGETVDSTLDRRTPAF